MTMGVVAHRSLSQPNGIVDTQVLGESLLVISRHHSRVPHLHVGEKPLFRHHNQSSPVHFYPAALKYQPLAVVGSPWHYPRQSGDAFDLSTDLGVLPVILVLCPAIE